MAYRSPFGAHINLGDMAHGTAGKTIGFDDDGAPAEIEGRHVWHDDARMRRRLAFTEPLGAFAFKDHGEGIATWFGQEATDDYRYVWFSANPDEQGIEFVQHGNYQGIPSHVWKVSVQDREWVVITGDVDKVTAGWVIGDRVRNHNDGGGAEGDDWTGTLEHIGWSGSVLTLVVGLDTGALADVDAADGVDNQDDGGDDLAGANMTAAEAYAGEHSAFLAATVGAGESGLQIERSIDPQAYGWHTLLTIASGTYQHARNICDCGAGRIFFATYCNNTLRPELYYSGDGGLHVGDNPGSWDDGNPLITVGKYSAVATILHFHGAVYDDQEDALYVMCGDGQDHNSLLVCRDIWTNASGLIYDPITWRGRWALEDRIAVTTGDDKSATWQIGDVVKDNDGGAPGTHWTGRIRAINGTTMTVGLDGSFGASGCRYSDVVTNYADGIENTTRAADTTTITNDSWRRGHVAVTLAEDKSATWRVGDVVRNDTGDGNHWTGTLAAWDPADSQTAIVEFTTGRYLAMFDNYGDGIENTTQSDATTITAEDDVVDATRRMALANHPNCSIRDHEDDRTSGYVRILDLIFLGDGWGYLATDDPVFGLCRVHRQSGEFQLLRNTVGQCYRAVKHDDRLALFMCSSESYTGGGYRYDSDEYVRLYAAEAGGNTYLLQSWERNDSAHPGNWPIRPTLLALVEGRVVAGFDYLYAAIGPNDAHRGVCGRVLAPGADADSALPDVLATEFLQLVEGGDCPDGTPDDQEANEMTWADAGLHDDHDVNDNLYVDTDPPGLPLGASGGVWVLTPDGVTAGPHIYADYFHTQQRAEDLEGHMVTAAVWVYLPSAAPGLTDQTLWVRLNAGGIRSQKDFTLPDVAFYDDEWYRFSVQDYVPIGSTTRVRLSVYINNAGGTPANQVPMYAKNFSLMRGAAARDAGW